MKHFILILLYTLFANGLSAAEPLDMQIGRTLQTRRRTICAGMRKESLHRRCKSGASDAANQVVDAELREVIDAWPQLPAAIKSGIMEMVRTGRLRE